MLHRDRQNENNDYLEFCATVVRTLYLKDINIILYKTSYILITKCLNTIKQ